MADIIQWAIFPVGLFGQYIVGRKRAWGYLVQLLAQMLWIAFVLMIDKPGLLLGAVVYAVLYVWNFRKWMLEGRCADAEPQREAGQGGSATAPADVSELG